MLDQLGNRGVPKMNQSELKELVDYVIKSIYNYDKEKITGYIQVNFFKGGCTGINFYHTEKTTEIK
ncbi:MAG: hypothetical protein ABII25_00585 [bacterium]